MRRNSGFELAKVWQAESLVDSEFLSLLWILSFSGYTIRILSEFLSIFRNPKLHPILIACKEKTTHLTQNFVTISGSGFGFQSYPPNLKAFEAIQCVRLRMLSEFLSKINVTKDSADRDPDISGWRTKSVLLDVTCLPNGWRHDHGPTNVGAMVKRKSGISSPKYLGGHGCQQRREVDWGLEELVRNHYPSNGIWK